MQLVKCSDKLIVLQSAYIKKGSLINWFSAFCFHIALWTLIFHHDKNYCHLYVLLHKAAHLFILIKACLWFHFVLQRTLNILGLLRFGSYTSLSTIFKHETGPDMTTYLSIILDHLQTAFMCSVLCPLQLQIGDYYLILMDRETEGVETLSHLAKITWCLVLFLVFCLFLFFCFS